MDLTLTARSRRKKPTARQKVAKKIGQVSRSTAMKMTWIVAALQGAVLLTFALIPSQTPPRLPLLELFWAASREPQFYPLVALLVIGPLLSVLAWQIKGRHQVLLTAFWIAFITLIVAFHAERVRIMLRVLAWEYL